MADPPPVPPVPPDPVDELAVPLDVELAVPLDETPLLEEAPPPELLEPFGLPELLVLLFPLLPVDVDAAVLLQPPAPATATPPTASTTSPFKYHHRIVRIHLLAGKARRITSRSRTSRRRCSRTGGAVRRSNTPD